MGRVFFFTAQRHHLETIAPRVIHDPKPTHGAKPCPIQSTHLKNEMAPRHTNWPILGNGSEWVAVTSASRDLSRPMASAQATCETWDGDWNGIFKYLRSGIDAELQLALLSVIDRQTLHQQGREPRAGASTERVEHQKTLSPTKTVINTKLTSIPNTSQNISSHCQSMGTIFFSVFLERVHHPALPAETDRASPRHLWRAGSTTVDFPDAQRPIPRPISLATLQLPGGRYSSQPVVGCGRRRHRRSRGRRCSDRGRSCWPHLPCR